MTGLEVRLDDPDRGVAVDLRVPAGTTTALLGPNGAGKTTVLSAIAGIHHPGTPVRVDGRDLTGLAAHRRGIPLLSQDPLLLPHLTALDNVAFGPAARGRRRGESRRVARDWLERVGAGHLADRPPGELSGGQARRVGLARALATEPSAMILDEPLAALDVDASAELRRVLREALEGVTCVIVTHDVVDVALLADHAVVLVDGRVVEDRPVADLLAAPRTPFAAGLVGTNLVRGVLTSDSTLVTDAGVTIAGVPASGCALGDQVVATFRPDAVAVHTEAPGGSPRNRLSGEVLGIEPAGGSLRLRAGTGAGTLIADVTAGAVAELGLHPGDRVQLTVKATAVAIHPA
ncbi:ATP-binding cassette domain-containing protein [Marihabitans asiaticum]|uniref:Molybdate transport system ATP-binding protein n=1 Tax=Marihabitans asiaticum TaxID=415218 RepID=A0A560WE30_9MICO|nr:ABC transporter ATP-binding protein [Marihabitans asiaticum]TWD15856.1 molybdate transport system ATP-binding protein [Marihabitans asiaticum]